MPPCQLTYDPHSGETGFLICGNEPAGDNIITDAVNAVTPLNIYDPMASGFNFATMTGNSGQINFGISNASLGGMSFLRDIAFPVLTSTTGAIFASNQIALQTFSAPALVTLGADLHLENNPTLVSIDLSSLAVINGIITATGDPLLTTVTFGTLTAMGAASMDLSGAALNVATVNDILVKLNAIPGLTGKTINLSGGTSAAPTGAGAAAKIALVAALNTVSTN